MDKLIRRLRRELTRNPKQSALLGLALLAALYFWAPLVAKWLKPASSDNAGAPGETAATQPVTTSVTAAATATAPVANGPDWRRLAEWMEADPLRVAAHLSDPARSPFQPGAEFRLPELTGEERHPEQTTQNQEKRPAEPDRLDLKLEGVFLAAGYRAAIINGTVYREQEPIVSDAGRSQEEPAAESRENAVAPVLAKVHADHVLVTFGQKTLRLELERPVLAPGDRIAPGRGRGEL